MPPPSQGRPVVAVVGATATGKSDLAVALAERLGGEVVNADASQLYRGMDIGTAKLTPAERRGVPHHQLDVLDVRQEASVAAYQRAARADIDAVAAGGRVPVLCGGSGLYVRAALDVLDIPPTDPAVRARIDAEADDIGVAALHARLADLDPRAAAEILVTNRRRIVRALEVVELTGRFSAVLPHRQHRRPTVTIGLRMPRPLLDERVGRRAAGMWDRGLLDEVEALVGAGLREGPTACRAIGYSQALDQLDGLLTRAAAVESTAAATRRLVRRQESWFRPDPRVRWLEHDGSDPLGILERALALVAEGPVNG